MNKTLKAIAITKSFPTAGEPLVVLDGIDLELAPGDAVAITGPSGCGKSTLLHILGTLDTPTSGRVLLGDQDPFALSEDGLAGFRRREIGFVFQDHHLLPQCTALENVLVPTLVGDTPRSEVEARARSLLQAVGLGKRLDHRPAELSGGERQRAAIARALIQEPPVLLCDEPTGNLDPATARAIGDLFLEIHRERGGVLIVVTHSAELAARLPRQIRLEAGRLESGRPDPGVSTQLEESGP